MALLTIIRGLPGSGKTTLAEKILRDHRAAGDAAVWAEADHFFTAADGTYTYDASGSGSPHSLAREHSRLFGRCRGNGVAYRLDSLSKSAILPLTNATKHATLSSLLGTLNVFSKDRLDI